MLEIVKLKNPFDRTRRETERVVFIPGQVLKDYIPDNEVEFVLNGNFVELPNLTFPMDGDQIIVLSHVGSGLKRIVGMVASMMLMSYVGNVAGGLWGGAAAKGTLGAYLAAGAVMYVGGRIINAIVPTQQASNDSSSSQTYGWDTPSPITGEGGIVGITYGECIPAPQVLERHVETVNDKQYLNLLLCGGMGPVDEISNIRIGKTDISNFTDVEIETRLGVNDQEPISFFTDTPLDQAVGLELSESGLIQTSDSTTAVSLEVVLEWSAGLYHIKDNGNFGNATVTVGIYYRKKGNIDWISFGDQSVTAAQNTALRRSFRVKGLSKGQYDVKTIILSRPTGSRYCTTCTWSLLTAYDEGTYSRPNKVLVGVRILATNQLSNGIPDITWRQTRNTVYVWNPETSAYETRSARNPIWAAYDIYHQCRYLKNINTGQYQYCVFGVDHKRLDPYWDEWVEAAAYSDDQVLGIDKVTYENRFEFDYYYDTEMKRYEAAQRAATVGHAVIMPHGNNIGIVCDKPGNMVQIFGEGRTTMSSVSGTFSATEDRALAVEVVYSETANDFTNTQFLVRSPKWNTAKGVQDNPAKLQLYGVKRKSQAYREGVYTLANNELVTQFVDLGTDIDAMVCEYGDVVGYNHSVSQIGIASGRIVSATENTIQLDKTVTLSASLTYQIILQLSDDSLVTKNVVAVSENTDTDTLTITEPFSAIPQQFDNYVFGETGKVVKPFRLVGVTKDGDLRCKLNLAEYVEGVYTGDLNYPIVDYTPPSSKLFEVGNLVLAEENYRAKDGTNVSLLHASWTLERGQSADEFLVYYSEDGSDWKLWGSTENTIETLTNVVPLRTYYVKVCTATGGMKSSGTIESLYITGKDASPSDIQSLSATIDSRDCTKVTLIWPSVNDVDLNGYRVLEGSTILTPTPISDTRYVYTATQSRQHNFSVVAVDNSCNPSKIPAITSINVTVEPAQVAGFSVVQKDTDRSRLVMSWQANIENDLSYYEIRQGDSWDTAVVVATQLKATNFELQLIAEGSYTYLIKAINISGHGSAKAAQHTLQIILRPSTPTDLVAVQEPRDRSMVKVTWTASPGRDIAGYEIRYGDAWDTGIEITTNTKEITYDWAVPSSGAYNIMVRAKTVAGYYSNVSNLSVSPTIEPYDVTGLAATQSTSDRTKVTLSWDNPISKDVSYFIIKKGATWDSGTVINQRATGTFYETIVTDETEQTFWIKAVSIAGNESQNAVSTGNIFNMNPSPVSNIQIQQNSNDKSVLNIMWSGISESDLTGYDVRIGQVWESAEALPLTQELYCIYNLTQTGNVKVMIKTVNAAGYYSDEVSQTYYATIEPLDVTGLVAYQNGETVELYWDKASEADVTAYEIREGANFDQGSLVATGVTQASYVVAIDTERTYQYWVKAINRSGHYSQNAISKAITVANLPVRNVIETFDEIALASGTHSNTEFGESLINFSNMGGKFSDYPSTKFSDVGGNTVLKLAKQVEAAFARTSVAYKADGAQVASGFPRYESDGLMIEEGTTNLLAANQASIETNTTGFHLNNVGTTASVDTTNYYIGTKSLKIVCDGTAFSQGVYVNSSVTSGATYTFSLFIKNPDCPIIIVLSGGSISGSVTAQTSSSWQRITITATATATGIVNLLAYHASAIAVTFWVGGLQFEQKSYSTSWIDGGAVRHAETLTIPASVISTTEGTIEFDVLPPSNLINNGRYFEIARSIGGLGLICYLWDNYLYVYSQNDLDVKSSILGSYVVPKGKSKIAVKWTASELAFFFNGVKCGMVASKLPSEFGDMHLGSSSNGYSQPNSVFSNLRVSNTAHSDARIISDSAVAVLPVESDTTCRFTFDNNMNMFYPAGTYSCSQIDIGKLVTANITAQFISTVILKGTGSAVLQLRTSQDDSQWTDWQDFKPVQYTFRYAEFRVLLGTTDTTKTPEVNQFVIKVDVPDTDIAKTATIVSGGTTVDYGHTFYTIPIVVPMAIGENLHAEIVSKTNTNCVLKIKNESNTDVGGQADVRIKGY